MINIDHGYVYEIEKFEFVNGVFEACKYFQDLGYEIIVVTNQSGISRGYYSLANFEKLTNWMIKEFEKNGIQILKVYHCPHGPDDNCDCRKPKIGMIIQSLEDFNIDLSKSWLIGDKQTDIQTATNSNIANKILISDNTEATNTSYVAKSLLDTISIINK